MRFFHYFTSFGDDVKPTTAKQQSQAYGRKLQDNEYYMEARELIGMTAISVSNTHWFLVVLIVSANTSCMTLYLGLSLTASDLLSLGLRLALTGSDCLWLSLAVSDWI